MPRDVVLLDLVNLELARAKAGTPPVVLRTIDETGLVNSLARPKILIVEDNVLLAVNVEDYLVSVGFDVVGIAVGGDEALVMAEQHNPQLVLMDIRLPGDKDGIDAARLLLERFGIRCIFVSAHSEAEMHSRAEKVMPAGWLTKPYALPDVAEAVRSALNHKH